MEMNRLEGASKQRLLTGDAPCVCGGGLILCAKPQNDGPAAAVQNKATVLQKTGT